MTSNGLELSMLDALGYNVCCTCEQDGMYWTELEWYSPAGEDCIFCIWHGNTAESFVSSFRKYADGFDVDEHVELWIDGRGENGVPETVRELLEDADEIKCKLLRTAFILEQKGLKYDQL